MELVEIIVYGVCQTAFKYVIRLAELEKAASEDPRGAWQASKANDSQISLRRQK